jgi:hypothetical protein
LSFTYLVLDENSGSVTADTSDITPAQYLAALPVGKSVQSYVDLSGGSSSSPSTQSIFAQWLQTAALALNNGGAPPVLVPASAPTNVGMMNGLFALALVLGLGYAAYKWLPR